MKRKRSFLLIAAAILCLLVPALLFAGGKKEEPEETAPKAEEKEEPGEEAAPEAEKKEPFDVAIFVPGVVAGSPLYEQMVAGAERAIAGYGHVSLKVIEAGFNQAEWTEKMNSLAAMGKYEVIVTSNPAMPFVSMEVAENFPDQKWLIVDAYFDGHPQFYTLLYNQVEQAYFVGYLGGLVTKSGMSGANPDLKAGMIVAQEYPALTKMIKPGYEMGLRAVDPNITVDYRVIGNWYDANKAADLANSMIDAGVDVILVIAGGANQGVIKAAQDRGKYVLFFDSNEYKIAPGTIVGCSILDQERAVYEKLKLAIEGKLPYGKAEIVHSVDGYVDFADDDPLYIDNVSEDVRKAMDGVVKKMRSGEVSFEVPEL
jgi:simple sugar transport system substrate-binding protein